MALFRRISRGAGHAAPHSRHQAAESGPLAGLEVPHVHLHLIPFDAMWELHFSNAQHGTPAALLAAEAAKIREALARQGHAEHATA